MKSRITRKLVMLTVALSTLLGTMNAFASDKVYRWRLAETWGPNFPVFGDTTKNMAEMVKKMSNGRLIIDVHSANKHKSALGIFDFVKAGQYQMGHSASYYWKGKNFNTMFFTTVPFGMTTTEQNAWFYHGGGLELMQEVYKPYGLLSYPGGNTGVQMGGWFRKEIKTVEDLKGLKMRIPGFAGEVLSKLGAKPTNIPSGELYTALERNTIDALEWVGPSLDLRMGFHKIAPYYYTGWHEPGTELQFLVNEKAFNKLPADLQEILQTAIRLSAYGMYSQSTHESAINLASIQEEYPNVEIRDFPKDVLKALRDVNTQLLEEFAEKDPMTRKILDSIDSYSKKARSWTNFSDKAYLLSNPTESE